MRRKTVSMLAGVLAILLTFAACPVTAWAAEEITDRGEGIFWLDAGVTNPEDYQNIVGFELTYKLKESGWYGGEGAMSVNFLIAAEGAKTLEDMEIGFEGGGMPGYVNKVNEYAVFGSGTDSWLTGMFWKNGIDVGAQNPEESITASYRGQTALFSEENSILTLYGFTGVFEIESVTWLFDEAAAYESVDWEPVETEEYRDVSTVENGTAFNYVDITVPAEGDGPFPVVLWIHGGAWSSFDRTSCIMSDTKEYLLANGYAFVSAEYTLTATEEDGSVVSGYPQMIYDLKAAVRFLRAHGEAYKLDTRFIAAMGESAGAHLAMLMGTTNGNGDYEDKSMGNEEYSSDIQAMVSYFGPSIFTGEENDVMAYAILGDEVLAGGEETERLREAISPYHRINADSPALFMTHGADDEAVPIRHTQQMEEMARLFLDQEDLTVVCYEHGPHANRAVFDSTSAMAKTLVFLERQRERFIPAAAEDGSGAKDGDEKTGGVAAGGTEDDEKTGNAAAGGNSGTDGKTAPESVVGPEAKTTGGISPAVWAAAAIAAAAAGAAAVAVIRRKKK